MKDFIDKIVKNKKIISLFLVIGIGIFGFVNIGMAFNVGDVVANTIEFSVMSPVLVPLTAIFFLILAVVGSLDMLVIGAIGKIAVYNNFIKEIPIIDAWVIVRDLSNMFFILILLVIAFATILRVESYNAKKMLPKLLIMAILINFSRTICGLIIDFSQVIMLTFVNAWAGYGGGFVEMTQMSKYFSDQFKGFTDDSTKDWSSLNTLSGLAIGIMFMILSGIVLVVVLGVFVIRIVMIWIYVVLSPLAFLLSALPAGQKYASQWWDDFIKQVVTGPVLAFFIWLAMMTSKGTTKINNIGDASTAVGEFQCAGISQITCLESFLPFILSIGMLIGGLMVAQQAGGAAGSIAGKGLSWAKSAPALLGKGAASVGGWGARKIKSSEGKFGGLELNPVNIYKGIKEGLAEKKRKEISEGEAKSADALRKGGIGGLVKGLGASKDMTEAMARGWFGKEGIQMAWQTARAPKRREELGEIEGEKKPIEEEIRAYKEKINATGITKDKEELKILEDKKIAGTATTGEKMRISELRGKIQNKTGEIKGYKKEIEDREARIDAIDVRAKKYKEEKPIRTPFTFAANMGRKKSVRDAMAKIGDNDNSEDLVDMWRHAKATKDKEMAAAVFLAAAKNGHSNEIIQAEKGNGTEGFERFKGRVYDTDQNGLNAFVKEQLMGELGMAEQEAFDYQSQFSSICKQVGHFMFAESVGSKNGMLNQKTDKEQEGDARVEARKVDPERYTRDRNRFGYGYENENREFRFNRLGLTTVMENAGIIDKEITRSRFNKNAAMKMLDDMETLEKYIKETGQTTYMDVNKDGEKIEKSWAELIIKMKEYGKAARDSGGSEFGSAADKVLKK